MTHVNYIVAIDLGTSHLVGMVGRKNAKGTLSILAKEIEDPASSIRRGCVYNVRETAQRIHRLVLKLQNKISSQLPGFQIEKVYIGVGGQSLRTINHSEVRALNTAEVVTEEDIKALDEQCLSYNPDMLDVLGISSPVYFLDDKFAANPVGIPCKRIEARYELIVGRSSIRKFIVSSLVQAKIDLAGILVSPLSLADAMLSRNEKDLGCILINLGAGVTSVVVYKNGNLIDLSVIPLGGDLITKDLMTLRLVKSEAERLKVTYGSALMDKNKEGTIPLASADGLGIREIEHNEINMIVEARAKEIVENVYARVEDTREIDALGAGIVLAGGASALKNLPELIQERFKQEVRYSTIRKEWMEGGGEMLGDPNYMTAISLLLKGTENCVLYNTPEVPVVDIKKEKIKEEEEEEEEEEEDVVEKKFPKSSKRKTDSKVPNLFNKINEKLGKLFDED
ncbi:MAG: cell division protein FtsA [Tannerella sp.]|jgi:cell division protein FtsA|nr:cell division protein FtsA [Tannerella sp.]